MKRLLLTGYSGFVGTVLAERLHIDYDLSLLGRKSSNLGNSFKFDLSPITIYDNVFESIDAVIHVAARAHIMNEEVADSLSEYRRVNVDGTLNLAQQSADAGVKRFIYISSIKVNGESTSGSVPFTEKDIANPLDPYGVSKYEAEEGLKKIAEKTGMEVVIIRPPLVYGAGVKANFLNLLKLSNTGLPLPFGLVNNKRSMVYVENLVDFIIRCIDHPNAANQTFLVSDGENLSLKSLITYIRKAMGKSPLLLPVPVGLFKLAGKLTGKSGVVDRLVGDLQVDSSKARELLDWTPPFTVEQGIAATVLDFKNRKN
mgnify:CR=1 FL=1